MKLFKKKRRANIKWMTVKCPNCMEEDKPRVMYVDQDEIKLRPTGYKGAFQAYVCCDKCGNDISIPNDSIPSTVLAYLTDKWLKQA